MKTREQVQAEYEIRLAFRQAEARGVIDADVRAKIEQKVCGKPQNPPTERINAEMNHETEGDSRFIVSVGKWWQNEPEWLSDGKRPECWTFSAAILAGAAVLVLAFLAFWAL